MAGRGADRYSRLYQTFLASRGASATGGGGGVMMWLLPLIYENPDAVDPKSKTAQSHIGEREEMTGLQRLKLMYSYDSFGNLSPELHMVMQSGLMGLLTGTVVGGTLHSRESYLTFIERNQGTAFQNMFEAKKELQNKVTIGFGRGAWKWGWRLSLFCTSFVMISSSIAAYRGRSSVLEYSVGGALTGAIYKLKLGPRGSAAGAIMGGALGTVAGCVNMAILYITGTSTDQLRKYHYEWQEQQQQRHLKELEKARIRDADALSLEHQSKVTPGLDTLAAMGSDGLEPNGNCDTDSNSDARQ